MKAIKILHADSSTLFRNTLATAINSENERAIEQNLKIVQSLSNGEAVVEACKNENFDLLILGESLDVISEIDVVKRILKESPNQKILLLSSNINPMIVTKSIQIGVAGHISKNCTLTSLKNSIEIILSGKTFFDSDALLRLLQAKTGDGKSVILSDYEAKLTEQICLNRSPVEIARFFKLTARTIINHTNKLFKKTGVKSKIELAIYATKLGLV